MASAEATTNASTRRVDVVLTVLLDPMDADPARRLLERLAGADSVEVQGRHSGSLLTLTIRGDARSILGLADGRTTGGEKVLDERAATVLTARAEGVSSAKAAAIANHLMNATQNRPDEDAGLGIRTEHDEVHERFEATLTGSLFATTYLLFLIHLQMTQSRT